MSIEITDWYCRLGNNIITLKNALHICFKLNYNLIIPKHNFFTTTFIKINNSEDQNIYIKENGEKFFYFNFTFDKSILKLNEEVIIKIIKNIFIFNIPKYPIQNILYIHIRSGDIFQYGANRLYVQPPLDFYINIIENNKFDKIIIIAEDKLNPCINKLCELYQNAVHNIQSLEDDIKCILSANYIISGIGTFIPTLLLLSDNIITHYEFDKNEYEDYWNLQYPWKNSNRQRKLMLTYKKNK